MPEHIIKLPDVGEGVAEAELVEWHVKLGDLVREDAVLAAVMTDKATVEIPAPVDGEVTWLGGEVGDTIAVGSPLLRIAVADGGNGQPGAGPRDGAGGHAEDDHGAMDDGQSEAPIADGMAPEGENLPPPPPQTSDAPPHPARTSSSPPSPRRGEEEPAAQQRALSARGEDASDSERVRGRDAKPRPHTAGARRELTGGASADRSRGTLSANTGVERPLASPAVRQRAREAGIDLRQVAGSGPAGRITHEDLDAFARTGAAPAGLIPRARNTAVEEVKVIGLRRRIAERMALAKARIPHITYVEEVDVTALEELRAALNKDRDASRTKLTLLPFLLRAMVRGIADNPGVNALFDDEAGLIRRHGGVHVGIATQTPSGLVVPVVRHAEALGLWDCAAEIARLAEAAGTGTATREELSGSTITVSSLGAIGGIVSTPVINHPEVAIVGVNKIAVRPIWDGAQFVPRKMMNLSSAFDHRVIDGWDAASFIQRLKALLESPALMFVD